LNPAAIHLLEANKDKINWDRLSYNPAAIHLLKENQDKIDWDNLSHNPEIFEPIRILKPFTEELMQNRFHPDNLDKFEAWGYE
jgi:hypothetical protein